ncbi:MAG: restriction endonuclease [Nitrococcus sp.]|nr:restriction endonuclease [Nitrococcus sp.]
MPCSSTTSAAPGSDEDFVFFNHERSRCGSTRRLSPVEIEVDLDHVPATVDAIVIAASLDDSVGGSVADHGSSEISFAGNPPVTHALTGLTTERCVIASGRIVISAKRYNHTVGPDHVRALDSVVGEQGAIKGILVTTSGFGPESYRIAKDKPLDLVDGQRLREWLHQYLGVTGR